MRFILTLLAVLLPSGPAAAGFTDVLRYVFVPLLGAESIAIIDSRDDSIAGSLETGLVPAQLDVDAKARRRIGSIRLPGQANAALMGKTFGICH